MPTLSIEPNPRITYKTLYEDDHLLIVSKPSGIVTTPGVGHERDTLLNGLFATHGTMLQNLGAARDYGLLHRLDKETSGVVAVALSVPGYEGVRAQFEARSLGKFYWAVCHAKPKRPEGVVRLPIAEEVRRRDRYTSIKFARITRAGKPALTAYRVLDSSDFACMIEARPITGRLHQVRVHLDAIGATVLGDPVYGPKLPRARAPRLALHAHRLTLEHPVQGGPIDAHTPWPSDLRNLLRKTRLARPDLKPDPEMPSPPRVGDGGHELRSDPIGK